MGHGASSQSRVTPTVVTTAPPAALPVTAPRSVRAAKSQASLERRKTAAFFKPSIADAGPLDDARFVTLNALTAHGKLPRCGSRPKYRHPLTDEGNANLCRLGAAHLTPTLTLIQTLMPICAGVGATSTWGERSLSMCPTSGRGPRRTPRYSRGIVIVCSKYLAGRRRSS